MESWVEVYVAWDVPNAYIIKAALEEQDIPVQITNEFLDVGLGGLPVGASTVPKVLVPPEAVDRAREVLRQIEQGSDDLANEEDNELDDVPQ